MQEGSALRTPCWPLALAGLIACTEASRRPGAGEEPEGKPGPPQGMVPTAPGGQPTAPSETGAEFNCQSKTQDPGPGLVRRLTVGEYLNTISDLLAVDASTLAKLPPDDAQAGFTNDARAQTVTLDHVEQWATVAQAVVAKLGDKAAFLAKHATCRELTEACFGGFIDNLGLRLLRRPPAEADRAAFAPILATVKADNGTFDEAALLVLEAMLQSPRFLYRVESDRGAGKTRALDEFELAARVAFLVTNAGPDEPLLAAAKAGKLGTDAGLAAELDRLLASERARRAGRAFLSDWLDLPRLSNLASPLAPDMRAETEALFDQIVWTEKKPLTALFDAPYTFASKALATHYKLPTPKDGTTRYELGTVPSRRGLLTHGSILSSGGEDASLVNRGMFILHNVLCATVPPPPVGVNNGRPTTEPGKPQRWYAEQRMSTSPCDACHKHLDPLAFPFEAFTGLGVFRDKDERGNPIATDGRLFTPYDKEGKPFKDAASFIALVSADERVRDCTILKPAQHALGRALDQADACTLAAMKASVVKDGGTFPNVLRQLAMQPSFRQVRLSP